MFEDTDAIREIIDAIPVAEYHAAQLEAVLGALGVERVKNVEGFRYPEALATLKRIEQAHPEWETR